MIRVTQGHENSISLEVFLKSFLLLNSQDQKQIILYTNKETFKKTCDLLNISFTPKNNETVIIENCILNTFFTSSLKTTQSIVALEAAIEDMNEQDILVTMPTTKDQIYFEGKVCSGHTDYFRKRFNNSLISMMFQNSWESILLLTEHIPLRSVGIEITEDLVIGKVSSVLMESKNKFSNVAFSGINPHAGENGLLGSEDKVLEIAIIKLKKKFPKINFSGPFAGDSLHMIEEDNLLKVYSYHDQGLTLFKGLYGFEGANITIGLPFQRLSVDHGTAFNLYGKNVANYMGCFNMLKKCLNQELSS